MAESAFEDVDVVYSPIDGVKMNLPPGKYYLLPEASMGELSLYVPGAVLAEVDGFTFEVPKGDGDAELD